MTCAALRRAAGFRAAPLHARRARPCEVRLALRAAGINFVDALITRGRYQYRPTLPFVPGLEAVGNVIECGRESARFRDRRSSARECSQPACTRPKSVIAADGAVARLRRTSAMPRLPAFASARIRRAMHCARRRLLPARPYSCSGRAAAWGWRPSNGPHSLAPRSSRPRRRAPSATPRHARRAHVDRIIPRRSLAAQVKTIAPGGVDVVFDPVGGAVFEGKQSGFRAWGGTSARRRLRVRHDRPCRREPAIARRAQHGRRARGRSGPPRSRARHAQSDELLGWAAQGHGCGRSSARRFSSPRRLRHWKHSRTAPPSAASRCRSTP